MQRRQIELGFPEQDVLGNFDLQALRRQSRVDERTNHSVHDVGFGELNRRKIDSNLDLIGHFHRIKARLCHDPLAKLNDQTSLLG